MQSNVKLLLVDDNPMVLAMLRDALAPLAHVTTADDGADALLKAVDEPPDVVVSDYRMPGMDGRQLIEKLKSRSTTSGIAVILLATKSDIPKNCLCRTTPQMTLWKNPSSCGKPRSASSGSLTRLLLRNWPRRLPPMGWCAAAWPR